MSYDIIPRFHRIEKCETFGDDLWPKIKQREREEKRRKMWKNAIFHIISQDEATRGKVEGNERIFSTRENDEKSSVIHSRIFFFGVFNL